MEYTIIDQVERQQTCLDHGLPERKCDICEKKRADVMWTCNCAECEKRGIAKILQVCTGCHIRLITAYHQLKYAHDNRRPDLSSTGPECPVLFPFEVTLDELVKEVLSTMIAR